MSILFSTEILDSIKNELQRAESSVQIITAYCKNTSFDFLNDCIGEDVNDKRLLVRFRMDDILKGSTDFSIIENGFRRGWDVYIRFDLHAKTYIVDKKRGIVGSANVTNSGLSINRSGNLEMATLVDVEDKDIEKIDKLFLDAIHMDEVLLEKLSSQINDISTSGDNEIHTWDASITTLFNPSVDTLFSYELPEEFAFQPGEYFPFLDETFSGNMELIKESFRWSNAFLWLVKELKENGGCMFFGELSEKLHNVLVTDPKPYRRDVKVMLSNLLSFIETLQMEDVVIDRPNYSQRVRFVDSITY